MNAKNKFRILLISALSIIGLISANTQAQSLSQARKWYAQGQYAKAKPTFERLLKANPGNGNYNLWYGVCCLYTGQPEKGVVPLEKAVKKRIPSGQLYLGQTYHALYRFKEAIHVYEAYIADLEKRKRSTTLAQRLLDQSRIGQRLLMGVEEVCFVDSVVMKKDDFLKAYKMGIESGHLFNYGDYFKKEETDHTPSTVYQTEMGHKIYYGTMQTDSLMHIAMRTKLMDKWGKEILLPDNINGQGNTNYPFVMADGVTLYYANDGAQSLGGYDIFVTRYNTDTDSYLNPENIGMPFNSPANDYLYAIDEYNNLGWFATDRNQSEGQVCIYTFIPNSSKRVYDYEATNPDLLKRLARLQCMQDSWTDPNAVAEARQRIDAATEEKSGQVQNHDFEFVVDDTHTYFRLDDFHSASARESFTQCRQLEKAYRQAYNRLRNMRRDYARENDAEKKASLTPAILDLEKRVRILRDDIDQKAKLVRNTEIQALRK